MEETFQILSCTPVALTVFGMGPFQEKPFTLDFTNQKGDACNFFLIISPNGRGKTTLLEAMASLMQLLDFNRTADPPHKRLWSNPKAWAQLDLLVVRKEGKISNFFITLSAGHKDLENNLKMGDHYFYIVWSNYLGCWHLDYNRCQQSLLDSVQIEMKNVYKTFGLNAINAPSLLYFDAHRDIPMITDQGQSPSIPPELFYRPLHHFGLHGDQWQHSLDNLLVWLTWLDDGRYEKAQEMINRFVFSGTGKVLDRVNRQHMHAVITSGGTQHRLDQLSSGEKSLMQLMLRIHLHLTNHSIVVIDELDAHLHPKLQHRLYQALKSLIAENPGLTLVATTHSLELIDQFGIDMKVEEPGLRLGGHLIDKEDI
ncbi:AAA family ATPase [uncultured Gammaproteobacteria bacterium]